MKKVITILLIPLISLILVGFTKINAFPVNSKTVQIEENVTPTQQSLEQKKINQNTDNSNKANVNQPSTQTVLDSKLENIETETAVDYVQEDTVNDVNSVYCPYCEVNECPYQTLGYCPNYEANNCPYYESGDCPGYEQGHNRGCGNDFGRHCRN